jgi:hypothetical protein
MIPAALAGWSQLLISPIVFDCDIAGKNILDMRRRLTTYTPTTRSPQYGKITASPQAQKYSENSFGNYEKTVNAGPVLFAELSRIQVCKGEVLIIRRIDKWASDFSVINGPFDPAVATIRWLLRINDKPTTGRFVGTVAPGLPHPDQSELYGIWPDSFDSGILVNENCTVQLLARLDTAFPKNSLVAGRLVGYRIGQGSDNALDVVRRAT